MIGKAVELFYDPINSKGMGGNQGEMSSRQLAFLLGMIKRHKPEKIVEIGVAEGGTTVAILNCLAMLDLEADVFSIDLLENLYRDENKKTGYKIERCNALQSGKLNHTLYTGKYAAECIESIGQEIDFLVLDTVHRLPGEFLDFLACFPFLKQGCVVVLHDTTLNHYTNNLNGFATKLLFDVVAAEKFLDVDDEEIKAGIGAFILTDDTNKYIQNVFSALTVTWSYLPTNRELELYRELYSRYYEPGNLELFNLAVQLNQKTLSSANTLDWEHFLTIYQWIGKMRTKRVYIYGYGNFGRQFYHILSELGDIKLGGYIISDDQNKIAGVKNLYYLSEMKLDEENDIVLIGVGSSLQSIICENLLKRGIKQYLLPPQAAYAYLSRNQEFTM